MFVSSLEQGSIRKNDSMRDDVIASLLRVYSAWPGPAGHMT